MSRIDDYVGQIGFATETLAKAALGRTLLKQYDGEKLEIDDNNLDFVLQAIRNRELGPPSTPDAAKTFAEKNRQLVRSYARSLPIEQRTPVFDFLYQQYVNGNVGLDAAASLAASVTNKVFGEEPTGDNKQQGLAFAEENKEFIEARAKRLAPDDGLCAILSGAAYNTCYARYVSAGGSRGMFSNRFLTYIRALSGLMRGDTSLATLYGKLANEIPHDLGTNVLAPVESMHSLGIFRPLPHNPNERQFYEAVCQFATKAGLQLKTS
jgi:hypothetical protein